MHIAASNPLALTSDLIDQSVIDKEQELVTEELKNSGKPEDIAKKISLGKMNKFKEENSLLTQAWVMEPKKKVQDIVKELSIADLKLKSFIELKLENKCLTKSHIISKWTKPLRFLQKNYLHLRTGRANASMLDLVKVDVYGQQMPINQVGSITTPNLE
jgi:hypothetical protein